MLRKLIGFIFRLILLALVIGVPCTWMLSRSYKNPEVHYYQVTQDRGEESLRFAVLSDLNGYIFAGGNSQIVEGVASVSPDAILMNGDMIDPGAENVSFLVSLIERLSSIAPVYYAYGEQEYLYATDGAANRSHRLTGETDKMLAFEKEITEAGATVIREGYQDVMLYGIPVRIGSTDESAVNYTMGKEEDIIRTAASLYLGQPSQETMSALHTGALITPTAGSGGGGSGNGWKKKPDEDDDTYKYRCVAMACMVAKRKRSLRR